MIDDEPTTISEALARICIALEKLVSAVNVEDGVLHIAGAVDKP